MVGLTTNTNWVRWYDRLLLAVTVLTLVVGGGWWVAVGRSSSDADTGLVLGRWLALLLMLQLIGFMLQGPQTALSVLLFVMWVVVPNLTTDNDVDDYDNMFDDDDVG